jgi:type IX secretion system substrate protein
LNKRVAIFCIFALSITNCYTQNLILNGSFEDLNITKIGFEQAEPFIAAGNRSPDLFIPFGSPNYFASDDTNAYGYQYPQHGQNYSGSAFYWNSSSSLENFYREPIIAKTNSLLINGVQYCFSFYISLADTFNCGINRIDAYFSSTPHDPTLASAPYMVYNEPQWMADTSQFYTDKLNWTRITGSYIATGGENYITIGNLHLDNITDTLCNGSMADYPNAQGAYYYMDNFSLEEIKPVQAGNNKNITVGNSTVIGNNSDSASTYTWSPNYFIDDTNAVNPTVNPPQTTTYYVTKTQCSVTTTDSVTVFVNPVGVSEYYNNTNFNLYPNPNNGVFNFNYNLKSNGELIIVSLMGQELKTIPLSANKNLISLNISNYASGIYTYKIIENKKLIAINKFVIQ